MYLFFFSHKILLQADFDLMGNYIFVSFTFSWWHKLFTSHETDAKEINWKSKPTIEKKTPIKMPLFGSVISATNQKKLTKPHTSSISDLWILEFIFRFSKPKWLKQTSDSRTRRIVQNIWLEIGVIRPRLRCS